MNVTLHPPREVSDISNLSTNDEVGALNSVRVEIQISLASIGWTFKIVWTKLRSFCRD